MASRSRGYGSARSLRWQGAGLSRLAKGWLHRSICPNNGSGRCLKGPRVSSNAGFFSKPQGETAMNLDLMLLIDRQFLETPFHGVRQMTWHLQNEGRGVN